MAVVLREKTWQFPPSDAIFHPSELQYDVVILAVLLKPEL